MTRSRKPRYIGMRHLELERRNSKSSGSSSKAPERRNRIGPQFAVCIENRGYPASLERHKIYRVLADQKAAARRQIRIIDESGEDYLYPRNYFVAIELPQALGRLLSRAS